MSAARSILEDVSHETGVEWDQDSMLEIMSEYIDNQASLDAFEDFVRRKAEEENAECAEEESGE